MKNLLQEFFNSKSDSCPLECLAQEKMEKDFQEWFEKKDTTFKEAVEPLMLYLGKEHHPHVTCIVRNNIAELVEGFENHLTDEFLVD
ncbi:MAG: hypothetical protein H7239_05900 [Flavobacterium sp.]|nr:hypothetical protein [Flavobacterium sp.]